MALKSGRTGVRNDQVDFYGRVKSSGKYEAGAGIVIEDDEISVDTETVAFKDDLEGKLDASKSAVASVGGIVTPSVVLTENEVVGVGVNGEQIRIKLGDGLYLDGTTSPYTLISTYVEVSYGDTIDYQNITNILSRKQIPYIVYDNSRYEYWGLSNNEYIFSNIYGKASSYIRVNSSNNRTIGFITLMEQQ